MATELSQKHPNVDLQHQAEPTWTGTMNYRALIPREKLITTGGDGHRALSDWVLWSGENVFIMTYPVSHGAMINLVSCRIWPEHDGKKFSQEFFQDILKESGYGRPNPVLEHGGETKQKVTLSNEQDPWAEDDHLGVGRVRWAARVDAEEVKNLHRNWEPDVRALIDALDKPLSWAVHQVGPLESFVNGKVCIMGDAAHAMPAHRGVGAGLAINDAYILASLFAAVSATNDSSDFKSRLATVLETYDAIRRPSVTAAAVGVRENGFHFLHRVLEKEGEWRTIDCNSTEDTELLQKTNGQWVVVRVGQVTGNERDREGGTNATGAVGFVT